MFNRRECLFPFMSLASFSASHFLWLEHVSISKSIKFARKLHCLIFQTLANCYSPGSYCSWITTIESWGKFCVLLPKEGEWMLADLQVPSSSYIAF
jgi:hypothetical protein